MSKSEIGRFSWNEISLQDCIKANDPKNIYSNLYDEQIQKNNNIDHDNNRNINKKHKYNKSKNIKYNKKTKTNKKSKRRHKKHKENVLQNYNKLKSKLNRIVYSTIFDSSIWIKSFQLKPEPNIGDWLLTEEGMEDENGQTFYQWFNDHNNNNSLPTDFENKIGLIPVPNFSFKIKIETIDINQKRIYLNIEIYDILRELIDIYFGMKSKSVFGININKMDKRINNMTQCLQISTKPIHKRLCKEKRSEPDLFCLIGISMIDLYPDYDSYNFVYGAADNGRKTAIFSFARYLPGFYDENKSENLSLLLNAKCSDDKKQNDNDDGNILSEKDQSIFIRRCTKVLCHEIGHLFGMDHCIYFQCIMNGANHIDEVDESPIYLCPICLNKLYFARIRNNINRTTFDKNNNDTENGFNKFKLSTFDVLKRYQNMSVWCKKYGLLQEYQWYKNRIQIIKTAIIINT